MNARKMGYWGATLPVAGMMLLSAGMYLSSAPVVVGGFSHLGYPLYLVPFLGLAKGLAGAALLYGRFPRLTEWAYAGLTFTLLGAAWSHHSAGDGVGKAAVPLVILALLATSYRLRDRSVE